MGLVSLRRSRRGFFEKYGIGELKYEHSEKYKHSEKSDSGEDSTKYSTPSLLGIGTTIVQTLYEVRQDSKLLNHNKPLLDILLRATNMEGVNLKLATLLPVRDFRYRTPKLVDSLLVEE